MKTLDEVIKAWSICFSDNSRSDCTGCPYADEDGEAACFNHDRTDALIYLRAYRWQMTNPDGDHLQLEKCRALLSDFYRNEPLSWEELRQMEGKPVWVEYSGYTPNWEIVENIGAVRGSVGDFTGRFVETNMSILRKEEQGKTWQAYRKERIDGQQD